MTSSRNTAVVDVGTPSRKFYDNEWATAEVRFHGFAGLTTIRNRFVKSTVFTCLGHQWLLKLYPGGNACCEEGKVGVYLENMSEESVEIKFDFSVKNSEYKAAENYEGKTIKYLFPPYEHTNREAGSVRFWGMHNFAKRSDLLNTLIEGALVVEVRMMRTDSNQPPQTFIAENPFNGLMLKTFMDDESADVVFEVGAGDKQVRKTRQGSQSPVTKFHAHRLILQQCAPMLAELCASGVSSTPVPITGVKPEIFRHVLYYLYGGKVAEEDLKSHAKEIIDAADRFSVVNLKLEAEACYVKSTAISADNMMELLLYSDSKNCALLKEAVMDFIVENDIEVLKKVSLKDVPGGLFADLLTAVARGKKKGAGAGDQGGDELSTMRIRDLRRKLHEKGLDIDGSRETLIATLEENA